MSIRERMAVAACDFADCRKAGTCVPGPISLCGALLRADRCLAASGRAELVEALRRICSWRDAIEYRAPDIGGCIAEIDRARALLSRIEADQ